MKFEKSKEINRPVLGFNQPRATNTQTWRPAIPKTPKCLKLWFIHLGHSPSSLSIGKGSCSASWLQGFQNIIQDTPRATICSHVFGPSISNPLLHCEHAPETTHRHRRRRSCRRRRRQNHNLQKLLVSGCVGGEFLVLKQLPQNRRSSWPGWKLNTWLKHIETTEISAFLSVTWLSASLSSKSWHQVGWTPSNPPHDPWLCNDLYHKWKDIARL